MKDMHAKKYGRPQIYNEEKAGSNTKISEDEQEKRKKTKCCSKEIRRTNRSACTLSYYKMERWMKMIIVLEAGMRLVAQV